MDITLYHVDAFTDEVFTGNPAAVCLLPEWLSEGTMQTIAQENNLPVTAFLVRKEDKFHIRWFTPEYELDLCGHGSLAASFVIFNYLDKNLQEVSLHSRLASLPVLRQGDLITLNFPAKEIQTCSLPLLEQGLGITPKEIYQHNNERCLAVFESEAQVKQLKPDMAILKKLAQRGIVATAPGESVDFVSRTFYPNKSISEDPVTGASHCLLVPYWSVKLNKTKLHARQISQRGGEIWCEYRDDRVYLSGKAVLYAKGVLV